MEEQSGKLLNLLSRTAVGLNAEGKREGEESEAVAAHQGQTGKGLRAKMKMSLKAMGSH